MLHIRLTLDDLKSVDGKLCDGSEEAFLEEFPSGVMEGAWDETALALLCGSKVGNHVNWAIGAGLLPISPTWGKSPKSIRESTPRVRHHAADVINPRAGSEPCKFLGKKCSGGQRNGQCRYVCDNPDRGGDCILRECMACELYVKKES